MMTPEERQKLCLGKGGKTTLDAVLDALLETARSDADVATATGAALPVIAVEAVKQTALLVEIRDQLKKGLLVKTVTTL